MKKKEKTLLEKYPSIFRNEELSDRAFRILAFLFLIENEKTEKDSDGWFACSAEEIAEIAKCDECKVKRALREIYRMGYIMKKRRGFGLPNLYKINREYQ